MRDLLMIVPSRGRPQNVRPMIEAWRDTGALGDGTSLTFAIDRDDPCYDNYQDGDPGREAFFTSIPKWVPMVEKLNRVARAAVRDGWTYVGFMGDDHLPRTSGWVESFTSVLDNLGPGIVYGMDGYQNQRLPTYWVMSASIISALDAMVPAPVEHLYCDNVMRDLGSEGGCLHYLSSVMIEHMHPVAGKGETDAGYKRVNSPWQYARDSEIYQAWREGQMTHDVAKVRALRG